MKRAGLLVVGLALLVAPATAVADDDSKRGEMYIKVYSGLGLSDDSDLWIRQPTLGTDLMFSSVGWEDHSLSNPSIPYIGVRFGYYLRSRPWLGFAVDTLHFKIFAEVDDAVRVTGQHLGVPIDTVQPMNAIVQQYNVANGINMFPLSVLGRLRLKPTERHSEGRVQPYAGVGAGPTLLYTQSRIDGQDRSGYEVGKLGVQVIAGVQLYVSRGVDLFGEYKFTYTEANGSVRDGSSLTDVKSNHFVVGAGFHF